jgi:hypothetical protein
MTPSPEDLATQYAQMSESELMELARSYDGLLEIAQVALRAEFARRGLEPPLMEEPGKWEFRRLVTVRRYRDLAEAYVGRSLLESAGIPAWIADENLVRMDWFYSNLVWRYAIAGRRGRRSGCTGDSGARSPEDNHLWRGRNLLTAELSQVRIG